MLRILLRLVLVGVALFVAAVALEMIAAESGEGVVLHTTDASGGSQETRLWVVDDDGHPWLRAGNPLSGWLLRLERRPDVEVTRGGQTLAVRGVPVPEARDRIDARMREKYGWADAYISLLLAGRSQSVPVRLDPRAEPTASEP
jgi:hypothetical protein